MNSSFRVAQPELLCVCRRTDPAAPPVGIQEFAFGRKMEKTPVSQKPPNLSPVITVPSGEPADEQPAGNWLSGQGAWALRTRRPGTTPAFTGCKYSHSGRKEQVAERGVKETV